MLLDSFLKYVSKDGSVILRLPSRTICMRINMRNGWTFLTTCPNPRGGGLKPTPIPTPHPGFYEVNIKHCEWWANAADFWSISLSSEKKWLMLETSYAICFTQCLIHLVNRIQTNNIVWLCPVWITEWPLIALTEPFVSLQFTLGMRRQSSVFSK